MNKPNQYYCIECSSLLMWGGVLNTWIHPPTEAQCQMRGESGRYLADPIWKEPEVRVA